MKRLIYILPLLFFAQITFGQVIPQKITVLNSGGGSGTNKVDSATTSNDSLYYWINGSKHFGGLVGSGGSVTMSAGTGVTITGTGTSIDPYVINATGGGSGSNGGRYIIPDHGIIVDSSVANQYKIRVDSATLKDSSLLYFPLRATPDQKSQYIDTFNLHQLRYSLADRDTTTWTDSTLIDKKYFNDRNIGGVSPIDTTNKWVNNVVQVNDSTINVFKGGTVTPIVIHGHGSYVAGQNVNIISNVISAADSSAYISYDIIPYPPDSTLWIFNRRNGISDTVVLGNKRVDSIWKNVGNDSLKYTINGRYHAVSSGGAAPSWSLTGGNTGAAYPDTLTYLGTNTQTPLRFKTNGIERMMIDSSGLINARGNISLGKNKLLLDSSAVSYHYISFNANSDIWASFYGGSNIKFNDWLGNAIYNFTISTLYAPGFNTTGSYRGTGPSFSLGGNAIFGLDYPNIANGRFIVSTNGNVGIWNTSPTAELHITGRDAITPPLKLTATTFTTTSASGTGTNATIGFTPNGSGINTFATGSTVIISGMIPTGYNGTYVVGIGSTYSVTIPNTTTGAMTTAGKIVSIPTSTPQAGAFEQDTSRLYFTPAALPLTRQKLAYISDFPISGNDLTAQTTVGTITTLTSAPVSSTYDVGGYINVTAISADIIQLQVVYTDENSSSQTVSFANLSTTGDATYSPVTIRVKANTTITLKTNLSTGGGSITFDAGGYIKKDY